MVIRAAWVSGVPTRWVRGDGNDHLACACGSPACPVAGGTTEIQCRHPGDRRPGRRRGGEGHRRSPVIAALILGHGVLPTPLLVEAIRTGATIKPIRMPSEEPEPSYRPSPELAEFVRMRDLFCRFPNCDVPADRCDIDQPDPGQWVRHIPQTSTASAGNIT